MRITPELLGIIATKHVAESCYIEDFNLGSYTTYAGSAAPAGYTTSSGAYGTQLDCPAATNLTWGSIQRVISAPTPFVRLRCKVRVTTTNPEDACTVVLHDGGGFPGGTTLYINPRREATSDPTRRCAIGYRLAGSGTAVEYFTEVLTLGDWYQIQAYISGTDLKASVQNLTAGSPANVYTAATIPPFVQYSTYDVLIFAQDQPAPGSPAPTVEYADVQICEPA
jgi:hypothetical protein